MKYTFQEKFNKSFQKIYFPPNLILLGYRGSIAHGMYSPSSDVKSIDDKDIMGVYIAPLSHYIGLNQIKETQTEFVDEWDVVCYELRKFIRLLSKSNPNVLSMLWCKNEHLIYMNKFGKLLRDNKELFLTKEAYHPFAGYANSKLKKMHSSQKYEGYLGAKRKALFDKFGYDCKDASHLIRLLKMCKEFLLTGKVNVFREKDSKELLAIKNGKYKLGKIMKYASNLFDECKWAYERSRLPKEINMDKVDHLLTKIIKETYEIS